MNKTLIIFVLLYFINCETWYDEVDGYNAGDGKNGYAGSRGNAITAFYLKGGRSYKVHYKGDSKKSWSAEFNNGKPVGIGKPIDGISISGGQKYRVRYKNGKWESPVFGYNIIDSKNGYAGTLGREIDAISIEGGKAYRVAYGGFSSDVGEVANRVVKNLFGVDHTYSYDYETTIINNYFIKVTVILLYDYNFNSNHFVKLAIKNNKIVDVSLGDLNVFEELNKVININLDYFKSKFESSFSNGMSNGSLQVQYYWLQKKIEIYAGSKITDNHESYRGGYKITIELKDNNDFARMVVEPCKVFLGRIQLNRHMISNIINPLINSALAILSKVNEMLNNVLKSLLPSFLGFCLFFVISLA